MDDSRMRDIYDGSDFSEWRNMFCEQAGDEATEIKIFCDVAGDMDLSIDPTAPNRLGKKTHCWMRHEQNPAKNEIACWQMTRAAFFCFMRLRKMRAGKCFKSIRRVRKLARFRLGGGGADQCE